jgi:D-arabinose 1-dehydrogenase-like Zn-dependent alcohol dehydrogenase
MLSGKKVLFPIPTISKEDVIFLKDLAEKGEYKPVIDRYYQLEQIVEAYKYVETGQKTGNVVIKVAD